MYFELCIATLSIFTLVCFLWLKIIMFFYNQYEMNYRNSEHETLYLVLCLSLSIYMITLLNYSQIDFITLSLLTTISYIYFINFV